MSPKNFKNPILPGFHPDPSICRVGREFYLVTSSFEYFPGVPIFHSRDLVNWRQLGHVLTRKSQLDLANAPSSCGIYAPTLRYHNGLFYMITTNVGRIGNFVVSAKRPEGPWSDPVAIDQDGIDPSLLFDEGRVYYTHCGSGKTFEYPSIKQAEVDLGTGKYRTKKVIWKGTGGQWVEGPHLFKFGSWYTLIAAEGGTSYGHSIVAARSKKPFGPFLGCPHNPILTHRDRPKLPIQALGHSDFVELESGEFWAVLLGIRPRFGRYHHLGRETMLCPVKFTADGWPVFENGQLRSSYPLPKLEPHPFETPPARDDFDLPKLRHDWQFVRNPVARDWSLKARPGFLRLIGSSATLDDVTAQSAVVRRQQHFDCVCRTKLDFNPKSENEEAGLFVRAREGFHYDLSLRRVNGERRLELFSTINGKRCSIGSAKAGSGPIELEVAADARKYTFTGFIGKRRHTLGSLPTRGLSGECVSKHGQMHFTGTMIGVYASGNGPRCRTPADFDWFEYAKREV